MRYFFKCLPEIETKSVNRRLLLMLDFDGTLSPIASKPDVARFPAEAKKHLRQCSKIFPVAIISGRSLKNIKSKVGLRRLAYAGNHGLEWEIGGKVFYALKARQSVKVLNAIIIKLAKLANKYPGIILENKTLTISVHYRRLEAGLVKNFKKEIRAILRPYLNSVSVFNGKKIIELQPPIGWNKGRVASVMLKYFQQKSKEKLLPVYLGDDETDENAFRQLKKGICVRVGRKQNSSAGYFIKSQGETVDFLKFLSAEPA